MHENAISTTAEAAESAAMPRRVEVSALEDGTTPPHEGRVTDKPVARKSPAEWAYERLVLYIRDFEAELDSEHEAAMGFTGADAGTLRIEGMGYFDPDILTFYGTDPAGRRTQLVQHVSQLNVILRALRKPTDDDAPRRIGFRLVQRLEDAAKDGAEAT